MHILFALVVYGYLQTSSAHVTHMGVYENFSECQRQGAELVGPTGPFTHFRCIAVNG